MALPLLFMAIQTPQNRKTPIGHRIITHKRLALINCYVSTPSVIDEQKEVEWRRSLSMYACVPTTGCKGLCECAAMRSKQLRSSRRTLPSLEMDELGVPQRGSR